MAKAIERVCPGCGKKKTYRSDQLNCSKECERKDTDVVVQKVNTDKIDERTKKLLLDKHLTLVELANQLGTSPKEAEASVARLKEGGYNVHLNEHSATIHKDVEPGNEVVVDSKDFFDGEWYKFGLLGDTHLYSKYARLDVLNALYDIYERENIKTVWHTGNMVDGECRFNKFDLVGPGGIGPQAEYNATHYPQRDGITTNFITGDDHEGWWIAREGLNVGRYLEAAAQDKGRSDLKFIGHVEADIKFRNKKGEAWMRIMHPGGGSAYATSYTEQKIVECVPLDTEILTRKGWQKYTELELGGEVLGYNIVTDKCEWTKVTAINTGTSEVVEYKNDHFRIRCTRNHKWALEWEQLAGPNPNSKVPVQYSRRDKLMGTIDAAKQRTRLIQSAVAPSGPGLDIVRENLINRSDVVQMVLQMTSAQRQAFIYGMMIGEGTRTGTDGTTLIFSQNPGPIQEGFSLACFLEGHSLGSVRRTTKKLSGEDKVNTRTTIQRKRMRMVTQSMKEVSSSIEPVWCPTTELGTWVMRQGDTTTITGNSFQGGEKPHILAMGHYHKLNAGYPRNVYTVQTGCTQDQTPFLRRMKIQVHVGGTIVRFHQSPTGEINRLNVEFIPFYDRGFYEKNDKYKRY